MKKLFENWRKHIKENTEQELKQLKAMADEGLISPEEYKAELARFKRQQAGEPEPKTKDPFKNTYVATADDVAADKKAKAAASGPQGFESTAVSPAAKGGQQAKANPAAVKQATVKASALAGQLQQVLKSLQGALGEAKIHFDHLIVETGNTEQGILAAYQNVLKGARSRTPQAPIKVNWIEEEQKFLVVDGLHRLVEFIENGQTSCYCEIDWNSGSGKWKLPIKEERFENFSLNELKRSMNGLAT